MQCDDGDSAAPAQQMGADRDHHLLDTWEATAMREMTTFCSQQPLEVVLSAFGLFPAHDPADPLWRDRMANVAAVATLDPVGALRTTALCLDGL